MGGKRNNKSLPEPNMNDPRSGSDFDIDTQRKRKAQSEEEAGEDVKLSNDGENGAEDNKFVSGIGSVEGENPTSNDGREVRIVKKKRKKKMGGKSEEKPGVCYLSRIPPRMDPATIRHMLSQFGEILRVYLAPEANGGRVQRRKPGKFQQQEFSEGWVEFADKGTAKWVAKMLNGEQIGGKKRSQFYYDIWNIKYLSKFKWDDLTEEMAYNSAVREQKMALALSAAKRERDFYLKKVDQSKAVNSIEERLKKRQIQPTTKVIRHFTQTKAVADTEQSKTQLSKDVLAGVFGGS